MFGLTPFGWRFAAALVGSLAILMLARIARRMTRSTLLGCVAGLLLALDGLEFVMSRTALLDIFLMFWVLAAFGCLVVDRDLTRARLAAAVAAAAAVAGRATRGRRAGACGWLAGGGAGCAWGWPCASKWNGDLVPARLRRAGAGLGRRRPPGRRAARGFLGGAGARRWLPASFGVLPVAAYLVTWTGWFVTTPAMTGSGPPRTASTPR